MPAAGAMQDFIHQKNLEHYRKLLDRKLLDRKLLAETTDDATRRTIRALLAAEESKGGPRPKGGMAAGAIVNPAEPDKKEQGGVG